MSTQITTAFVNQYSSNINLLSQQKPSKFAPCVRMESVRGEQAFFEQIGAVEAQPWGARHSDTPLMDTPHARRQVQMNAFNWADLIDDPDKVRMLIDPTSSYATNAVYAFNRKKDDIILAAALADAKTGKDGMTIVPLPATQKIVAGGTGLTLEKLRETRRKFKDADLDDDIPLYFAMSPAQEDDLLGLEEVTSADYNTIRALVRGDVDTFMGFKFVRSTRVAWAANTRSCVAWAKDGLLLATGRDIRTRISERDDKNYSTQVFCSMDLGATRMEEVKVVQIDCTEVH